MEASTIINGNNDHCDEEESAQVENEMPIENMSLEDDPTITEEINIDTLIKSTLKDIKEVDGYIKQLNDRRNSLLAKYEELKDQKRQQKCLALSKKDWEKESYTWTSQLKKTLKDIFKMTKFRPQQLKAINAVLSKHDVLLLAPTGGGKSLCYQLPAIISPGITVIVSPLLSLMEDQVWSLQKLGVNAEMLCSTTDRSKNTAILSTLSEQSETCDLKILYVTPERVAKSKRFQSALQKSYYAKKLNMIAIDEVHCCSQWGHDFRPDYKFLGSLKNIFPNVPILGVTATATSKVVLDVQKMLNMEDSLILKAPFNRPNLYYQVIEKPSEKQEVYKLLSNLLKTRYPGQSGIIYTFSIKDSEDVATELVKLGIKARPYHATLHSDRRTKIHTNWLNGTIQVVVATVAFGMGIDKPDVRFVIHHTISKSIENFYQESGRAGRDGKRAECILLYRFMDMSKITAMMFSEKTGLENAYAMVNYCINGTRCRRDIIADHFTEVWNDNDCNKMCDHCYHRGRVIAPQVDIKKYCYDLYTIIEHSEKIDVKLTGSKLVDAWFGKGAINLRTDTVAVPNLNRYYAEQIVAHLITEHYLKEDFHFTAYSTISYIKRGANRPDPGNDCPILFRNARVFELPDATEIKSVSESYTTPERRQSENTVTDDVVFISEDRSKSKKRKNSGSSSKTSEKSSSSRRSSSKSSKKSLTYGDGNKRRSKQNKDTSKQSSDEEIEQTKHIGMATSSISEICADGINDDVLVLEHNGEVIEID